ncbi:MAG TPA: MFS transporter [Candidatus Limnocylindrales bacterium]|nr:MFS transporter [Candidatus Limnocylindrales bacterium]
MTQPEEMHATIAVNRDEDGLWSPGRRALTVGLVLNVTIVASEALAVSTIMPIVARDLGGLDLYGWVFSGFFLGNLLGIVIAGMLIDRGSLSRPFLMGIGLFSLGLAIGGLSPSMPVLVAARVIQGFGAGAIPAVAYVSIGRALPERLRPRMFATLSTAWVLPGVIGPSLAGVVAETLHWRVVFLGLLPLIAIAVVLVLPALRTVTAPRESAEGEHQVATEARRRLPLATVLVAGAGLIVGGLSNVGPAPLALIGIGLLLATPAFARLTPPGTLRASRGLPAAVLVRGLLTFAFFCADAYVPLAIQEWRGLPAVVSGLVFTAATLSWTGGAWIQAQRIERLGPRRFLAVGSLTLVVGVLGFATILIPTVPLIVGVVTWSIAGLGMGFSYSTLSLVVLREAPPEEQGSATAGLQLSDVLGTSLGTGLGGALVAAGIRAGSPGWVGLAETFGIAAIVGVIAFVVSGRVQTHRLTTGTGSRGSVAPSVGGAG